MFSYTQTSTPLPSKREKGISQTVKCVNTLHSLEKSKQTKSKWVLNFQRCVKRHLIWAMWWAEVGNPHLCLILFKQTNVSICEGGQTFNWPFSWMWKGGRVNDLTISECLTLNVSAVQCATRSEGRGRWCLGRTGFSFLPTLTFSSTTQQQLKRKCYLWM